jgi:prevent-host-death family protein
VETIELYEAEANFSALVERAAAGEEIIIAKAGHPLARSVPLPAKHEGDRPLGLMRGQIWIGDDFDDPLPQDLQDGFDGKGPLFNDTI